MTDIELEQLNHAIAAIAGYTDIKQLDTSRSQETQPKKKLFVGKYKGVDKLIPDYVSSIDTMFAVFKSLDLRCSVSSQGAAWNFDKDEYGETPAIALCKLLVAIHGAKATHE